MSVTAYDLYQAYLKDRACRLPKNEEALKEDLKDWAGEFKGKTGRIVGKDAKKGIVQAITRYRLARAGRLPGYHPEGDSRNRFKLIQGPLRGLSAWEGVVLTKEGKELEFSQIEEVMDPVLQKAVFMERMPCSQQAFYDAYCEKHERKYGRPFRPGNTIGEGRR